jgi:hypothetical protein
MLVSTTPQTVLTSIANAVSCTRTFTIKNSPALTTYVGTWITIDTSIGSIFVDIDTPGSEVIVVEYVYDGVTLTTVPLTINVVCSVLAQNTLGNAYSYYVPLSLTDVASSTLPSTGAYTYTTSNVLVTLDTTNKALVFPFT